MVCLQLLFPPCVSWILGDLWALQVHRDHWANGCKGCYLVPWRLSLPQRCPKPVNSASRFSLQFWPLSYSYLSAPTRPFYAPIHHTCPQVFTSKKWSLLDSLAPYSEPKYKKEYNEKKFVFNLFHDVIWVEIWKNSQHILNFSFHQFASTTTQIRSNGSELFTK